MREFEKDYKINFVDVNDVLVGFDNSQNCCENFGWFYSESLPTKIDYPPLNSNPSPDLEAYVFDSEFFHQVNDTDTEANIATFKLVNGAQILYLNLYNSHNGYYSHGFQVEVAGKVINTGSL